MKRIAFFASFVGALFLLAGVSYLFIFSGTKASTGITNIRAENIVGSGAEIKWNTDTPSDSRVAYGASTVASLFSNSRCDAGGYVTNHCVNLTGLSAGTTYYYKVESMDTAGVDTQSTFSQFVSAVVGDATSANIPLPPSSLTVSLSTNGADATFSWADGSSNESVFKVFKRLSGDTGWGYFISIDAGITSLVYPGVPYGTYEYVVSACNVYGCSPNSNTVSVTRSSTPDATLPSIPQNVVATATSDSKVDITWTASTDNIGVTGYNVYRDGNFIGNSSSPSYSDSSLFPSTLYYYTVAARDAAGNFSQGSQRVSATTLPTTSGGENTSSIDDTTPPVISAVDVKNIIGSGAQITWVTDDPSSSKLSYGTTAGLYPTNSTWRCDAGGNVTAHCINLSGLSTATHYYYQVVSKNSAGYEAISTEQSFVSASSTTATSLTGTTVFGSTTTTTTAPLLIPAVFLVKAGSPYCLSGSTVGDIFFSSDPFGAGYFTITGGNPISSRSFTGDKQGILPAGTYSWKVTPKAGYYVSQGASGTLNISTLSCSSGETVTTATQSISPVSPRAYIALWQNDLQLLGGALLSGNARINVGVEGAESVSLYYSKNTDRTDSHRLGSATPVVDRPSLWRFSLDSRMIPNGKTLVFSRVTNKSGEYAGDGILVDIENVIGSGTVVPTVATAPLSPETPKSTSQINTALSEEVPTVLPIQRPVSYLKAESLIEEKYKEAERLFREENKIPTKRVTTIEEKQHIVTEMRTQFPVLSPAADSILLGTTTLSRLAEPEYVAAEVSRVIALRAKTTALVDTDQDNISDYDEVNIYGTDAKKSDTDGDGIKDGEELLLGTDPLKKVIVPLPHEDPKEEVLAAKIDSKIFSVQKIETINGEEGEASTTKSDSSRVAFSGVALPDSFVTIYIFSTPVIVTVKTDSDGKWKYTMDKELADGSHEVYVAMTESAGKILVKSDPLPFVKTAQAVTLQSDIALVNAKTESSAGFFEGGALALSFSVLFLVIGLSFLVISFVSKKREVSND
jgi:hypothetical protein